MYHHLQRGTEQSAVAFDHFDHSSEHDLRSIEVGDHTVLERTNRLDILMGLTVHLAGSLTDGLHLAGMLVERNDRRLVHYDLTVADNDRIGGSQIDGQLLCQ